MAAEPSSTANANLPGHTEALITAIRASVIGRQDLIDGPFGPRPLIYADYTASGRSLEFIEDYLRTMVLPLYANTHTESSYTGRQTTSLREEARQIIATSVGATDQHAVVFCGSGATAAVAKLVDVLGLRVPSALADRGIDGHLARQDRPVVFIGPYEHHSNELPWRESIADLVRIDEDQDGHIDTDQLRHELERHADQPLLIGSFSAASNVTGIVSDVAAISSLLHEYGALSLWDYAAAAPYVAIDVDTSSGDSQAYLDAIFLSPHKLIGGPGTPGVLVARRELFANRVPVVPGGGTVRYVNPIEHDYYPEIELREEGGTPAIIESIRAGLVFQLKDAVGTETISEIEAGFVDRAIISWSTNPRIDVLGSTEAERLSIVSFIVRCGDQYLHHNYVVALLDDLFGIQSRGGCSCAGPYGHRLLGIDLDRSHAFRREIGRGCEGIKPGWVRLNFNYFIDEETFQYLVDAVNFVADHGRAFLPQYRFEPLSGLWRHVASCELPPAVQLSEVTYRSGRMHYPARRSTTADRLDNYVTEAERLVAEIERGTGGSGLAAPQTNEDFETLRWFPYPVEAGPDKQQAGTQ